MATENSLASDGSKTNRSATCKSSNGKTGKLKAENGSRSGAKAKPNREVEEDSSEERLRQVFAAIAAFRDGDFTVRLPAN